MGADTLDAAEAGQLAEQPSRVATWERRNAAAKDTKMKTVVLAILGALCVVGLVIGLSVGLTQRNQNSETSNGVVKDPSDTVTLAPSAPPSGVLTVSPSVVATTSQDTPTPTMLPSIMVTNDSPSICPAVESPCMDEENHQNCKQLEATGCGVLVLESCPLQFQCAQTASVTTDGNGTAASSTNVNNGTLPTTLLNQETYVSVGRSFDVQLNTFGTGVLEPYNDEEELRADLTEIAKYICNSVLAYSMQYMHVAMPIAVDAVPVAQAADESSASVNRDDGGADGSSSPSAEGVDDFETNNQEEGVDEGDLVKSDGTHNYVAYRNILVVWNAATGDLVMNLTMPPIDYHPNHINEEGPFPVEPESPIGGTTTGEPDKLLDGENATQDTAEARSSFVGYWQPKPHIRSLVVHDQRLVVIVEGYGEEMRQQLGNSTASFYDHLNTRVMIYDTSNLPNELPLVQQNDIQGSFRDVRAMGSVVHMVTTAGLNTYQLLSQHLERWQPQFAGLSDDEYKEAAISLATDEYIPAFVDAVVRDITSEEGLPNLSRISLWQSVLSNETESIFSDSPISSYTQLTSFDVSEDADSLTYSVAGSFTPSSWGYTYAVGDMLVFAMQGWDWIPELEGSGETTYLIGFSLDGASSKPHSVGAFPGYLLNQYSLDIYNGHLRIATTIRSVWVSRSDETTDEVIDETADGDVVVEPMPLIWETRSVTQNQVLILEIPTDDGDDRGILTEVSRIPDLGKPGEVFTTVRFFDERAYAVTFERTDPFYVLDLDPEAPGVLGELNITGFSSYLHPINPDKTLLLAVGQEADEDGNVVGLQMTLFDATDPTDPTLLQRHVVEEEKDVWSDSSVEFDFKAFRYVSLGAAEDAVGVLILPLRVSSWQNEEFGNFDGFRVYDVSKDGISERLEISHVDSGAFYGCYYGAYLPERSFVFDGDVTTLKGHSIVSTDLDSGVEEWKLEMPKPENGEECYYW